jgi:hypothetical protein
MWRVTAHPGSPHPPEVLPYAPEVLRRGHHVFPRGHCPRQAPQRFVPCSSLLVVFAKHNVVSPPVGGIPIHCF